MIKFHFPLLSMSPKDARTEIQAGLVPGGRVDAETIEGDAYWFASPCLLSLPSYRTQDHQSRDDTTHHGPWSLPTPLIPN